MADSPLALQSGGTALLTTRVLVFCISAFFAGLSGALSASLFQNATSTQYDFFSSLTLFALLVIVVVGEPWYALVASLVLVLLPAYLPGVTNINTYLQLLFGVSAVFYVFAARRPLTVPAPLKEALQRLGSGRHRLRTPAGVDLLSPAHQAGRSPATATARSQHVVRLHSGLEVNELTVRYGGVVAVDGLTLSASLGTITGLIGPNGAGKTTTFAACSGLIRPSSGRILLGGRDITKAPPEVRARLGLGRTFQRVELYDSLTVAENVAMGCEAALAGGRPWRQLLGRRGDNRTIRAAVEEAIAVTGIDDLRGHQVGLLSTGQQRLVELARALAGPYDFLLLDEPSSGLDASESRHFGQTLRSVVQERGTGILLVEHDMTLVRDICSHIYVLDYGALMFHGTPEEMRASEVVRAAYLGTTVDEPQALLAGHGPSAPTLPVNEDLT
jgi:ABC-type branched-subunit amino acid transport system ATPase component